MNFRARNITPTLKKSSKVFLFLCQKFPPVFCEFIIYISIKFQFIFIQSILSLMIIHKQKHYQNFTKSLELSPKQLHFHNSKGFENDIESDLSVWEDQKDDHTPQSEINMTDFALGQYQQQIYLIRQKIDLHQQTLFKYRQMEALIRQKIKKLQAKDKRSFKKNLQLNNYSSLQENNKQNYSPNKVKVVSEISCKKCKKILKPYKYYEHLEFCEQ